MIHAKDLQVIQNLSDSCSFRKKRVFGQYIGIPATTGDERKSLLISLPFDTLRLRVDPSKQDRLLLNDMTRSYVAFMTVTLQQMHFATCCGRDEWSFTNHKMRSWMLRGGRQHDKMIRPSSRFFIGRHGSRHHEKLLNTIF